MSETTFLRKKRKRGSGKPGVTRINAQINFVTMQTKNTEKGNSFHFSMQIILSLV